MALGARAAIKPRIWPETSDKQFVIQSFGYVGAVLEERPERSVFGNATRVFTCKLNRL